MIWLGLWCGEYGILVAWKGIKRVYCMIFQRLYLWFGLALAGVVNGIQNVKGK